MFGNLHASRIDVVLFTSDNAKGIASLFGDMAGMGVQAITVRPGHHDHVIERMIRHLKETVRATIASQPLLVANILMPYVVISCTKKIMLFLSSTRTDRISPFEVYYGRKVDATIDIGLPFGTYCQVASRKMSSVMEPRTIGCLYLGARTNGSGTHDFLCLSKKSITAANHMTPLPFPPVVVQFINEWAGGNKLHVRRDPVFTYHDQDITLLPPDDDDGEEERDITRAPHTEPRLQSYTIPPTLEEPGTYLQDNYETMSDERELEHDAPQPPDDVTDDARQESPAAEVTDETSEGETGEEEHEKPEVMPNRTGQRGPPEVRQPSTRIRRPISRLNLLARSDPTTQYANLTVSRAMRTFPEKTITAMEGEVRSLLSKKTFSGILGRTLSYEQKRKILRSNMNIVEKYPL